MLKLPHILITGGTGCIGRLCLERLQDKAGLLLSLSRTIKPDLLESINQIGVDIVDTGALQDVLADYAITHIIHTAGLRTSECKTDPLDAFKVNTQGTASLFEAARLYGKIDKIVLTSTAAVYDTRSDTEQVDENAAVAPLNPYSASKLAAEQVAETYFHQYGIPTIILRPQIVFGLERTGSGSTIGPSEAMRHACKNQPYEIGYRGTYTYHHTSNVADYHCRALLSQTPNFTRYNLPGISISVAEIASLLNTFARQKYNINHDLITYSGSIYPFAKKLLAGRFLNQFPQAKITSFTQAINQMSR